MAQQLRNAIPFGEGPEFIVRDRDTKLHKRAAEIELASPASERWCVNTEDYNESGRAYLELAAATPAEAERGMAMLKKLVS